MCVGVGSSDWNEEKRGKGGCQTELYKERLFLEHGLKVGHTIHFFHVAVMLQMVFYTLQYYWNYNLST